MSLASLLANGTIAQLRGFLREIESGRTSPKVTRTIERAKAKVIARNVNLTSRDKSLIGQWAEEQARARRSAVRFEESRGKPDGRSIPATTGHGRNPSYRFRYTVGVAYGDSGGGRETINIVTVTSLTPLSYGEVRSLAISGGNAPPAPGSPPPPGRIGGMPTVRRVWIEFAERAY